MQNAIIRLFHDVSCGHLEIEAPISRAEAMAEILAGFRAASEHEPGSDPAGSHALSLQWAGYELYRAAAPLGTQHLTRVQLRPSIGAHRYEYVFPGGLSTAECDDLWFTVIGENGADESDRELEWLVTGTLAGMLHAEGVSLADYVIDFVCGQTALLHGVAITPATPSTRLYATVRDLGWNAAAQWLHDIQTTLEQGLDTIRKGHAVWVPASAPTQPWEPLIFRCYPPGHDCMRLAMGAEAAAYDGRRVELVVSAAEQGAWLTDRDAQQVAQMSKERWRRWIRNHREVRIGRPVTRDGRLAKNKRLVHRDDLRRALPLAQPADEEPRCMGLECPQRCFQAHYCPHRHHHCPG